MMRPPLARRPSHRKSDDNEIPDSTYQHPGSWLPGPSLGPSPTINPWLGSCHPIYRSPAKQSDSLVPQTFRVRPPPPFFPTPSKHVAVLPVPKNTLLASPASRPLACYCSFRCVRHCLVNTSGYQPAHTVCRQSRIITLGLLPPRFFRRAANECGALAVADPRQWAASSGQAGIGSREFCKSTVLFDGKRGSRRRGDALAVELPGWVPDRVFADDAWEGMV